MKNIRPLRRRTFCLPIGYKHIISSDLKNKKLISSEFSQIYIQIVFAVKGLNNLIQNSLEEELYKYIRGIVQNKGQKTLAIMRYQTTFTFLLE